MFNFAFKIFNYSYMDLVTLTPRPSHELIYLWVRHAPTGGLKITPLNFVIHFWKMSIGEIVFILRVCSCWIGNLNGCVCRPINHSISYFQQFFNQHFDDSIYDFWDPGAIQEVQYLTIKVESRRNPTPLKHKNVLYIAFDVTKLLITCDMFLIICFRSLFLDDEFNFR